MSKSRAIGQQILCPPQAGYKQMYKLYVLKSKKDNRRYIGYTKDIERRLEEHNRVKVESTCRRRPLELIYFEEYFDKLIVEKREKFLKSGRGRKLLDEILLASGGWSAGGGRTTSIKNLFLL